MYGIPAAVAGFLLARRIVTAPALVAFVLGALAALLSAALSGLWMALLTNRFISWSAFASDAVIGSLGQVVLDVLVLRGLPLVFGGFAALGLRFTVTNWTEQRHRSAHQ